MYVQNILNSNQSEYISALNNKNNSEKDADSSEFSPASWGAATVIISSEARAAQQSAATANQNEEGDAEGEEGAAAAFGEFMGKARGKVSSDPSEQLAALKSKLTQLQARKNQGLSNENLPEEAKTGQVAAIDGQINQIMALIAELESQLAQQGQKS